LDQQSEDGYESKAYLRYSHIGSDGLDLRSTVVPPAFEGQGIAKILARCRIFKNIFVANAFIFHYKCILS
jgi:predicted GNAT family acetyltransferase